MTNQSKRISQETFDETVKENMDDFDMSREDAIAYMKEKTGQTEDEVVREIERYVVWPAQATAYKTGQLSILAARARAEAALGDRFDLRAFPHAVLEDGALPLWALREKIERWSAAR